MFHTKLRHVVGFTLALVCCSALGACTAATKLPSDDLAEAPWADTFNGPLMRELFDRLDDHTYKNIHSMLLLKDGKLLVEKYYTGTNEQGQGQTFGPATLQDIASATKSVNGLLIGIAIDRHLIRGVDEKISTFFPEEAALFADPKKGAIRLRDCLSMTAGLAWDEWTYPYTDPRNSHVAMNASPDPVRYVLQQPMTSNPGEKFVYSSGVAILLGEIIHRATGRHADAFAAQNLFQPLGITEYQWLKYPNGAVQTGGGLSLGARDMAKIGLLCLNGGRWGDQQVVSASWIQASIMQHAPDRTYGYQWWLGSLAVEGRKVTTYGAQGRGGQFILMFPELNMVGVFTGWNEGALGEQAYDMLQRYILPAALQPPA